MNIRRLATLSALFVIGCGLPPADGPVLHLDPAHPAGDEEAQQVLSGPTAGQHLGSCIPERAWQLPTLSSIAPRGALITPSGGLVVLPGSVGVLRAEDGAPHGIAGPTLSRTAMDAAWTRWVAFAPYQTLQAYALPDLTPTVKVLKSDEQQWRAVSMSADGSRVAAILCTGDLGELRVWTEAGEETASAAQETLCTTRGLALTADGALAVTAVATEAALTLMVMDTGSGEVLSSATIDTAGEGLNPLQFPSYGSPLAMQLRPDGGEVAVVTDDGLLHRLTLPDLAEVGSPLTVSIAHIAEPYVNWATSPIAWSSDGSLLAHLGENGSVVVRPADTDGAALVLPMPTPAGDEDQPPFWGPGHAVTDMVFSQTDAQLVIARGNGVELFRCPASVWPVAGALTVQVTGPSEIPVGEESEWLVSSSSPRVASFRLLLDGELLSTTAQTPHLRWRPQPAGTYELTIAVDDGHDSGVAQIVVTVK